MRMESGRRSLVLLRELTHQWETGAIDWREYRAARASLLAAQANEKIAVDQTAALGSSELTYDVGDLLIDRPLTSDVDEPRILSFEDFRRQSRGDRFQTREGGRRRAG